MDDLESLNWTLIDQMVAALTPEQREAAEWRIAHSGKIAMQDFKVCMFGACQVSQELNVSSLDIYRVPVCSRIGCLHWPHSDPNLATPTDFPG